MGGLGSGARLKKRRHAGAGRPCNKGFYFIFVTGSDNWGGLVDLVIGSDRETCSKFEKEGNIVRVEEKEGEKKGRWKL